MSEPLTSQSGSDSDTKRDTAVLAPTPPSRGGKARAGNGGGRARGGRGTRARGRGRGRASAAGNQAAAARRNSPANGARSSDEDSDDNGSQPRSRRTASPELAAPPSPELAAPSVDQRPQWYSRSKSSSLSEHSSRQSSPGTLLDESVARNSGASKSINDDGQYTSGRARTASVSSALSALSELKEDSVSSDTEHPALANAQPPHAIKEDSVVVKEETVEAANDSESELSETDHPESTTASASKRQSAKQPRGRGRPRGAKRGFPGGGRGGRQAAAVAAATTTAATASATVNASAANRSPASTSGNGASVAPRATRANVTLPPGYIEGVTGSRWPRVNNKQTVTDSEDRSEAESKTRDNDNDVGDVEATEASENEDAPMSNIVIEPPTDAETDAGSEMTPRITPKDTPKSSRANSPLTDLTPEPVTDSDRPATTSGGRGGRGGHGGRGRKGRKGMTKAEKAAKEKELREKEKREQDNSNRAERLMSKRRKMEHLTVEQVEARNVARSRYLKDLDRHEEEIHEGTHPLIEQAKAMLDQERIFRLSNLAKIMARREHEFEQLYEAAVEQEWRQWETQKDSTRMVMYFENHFAMRRLLNEEKAYPFLCDHPLLSNSFGVPLAPYYRAPVLESDSAYVPRAVIHAGHYLEPPPLNPALDHSGWKLPASDIESDLALLRDYDGDYVPPPPLPPQTVMPLYGYPSPEVLYQAGYQSGPYGSAPPAQPYYEPARPAPASNGGLVPPNHAASYPPYSAPSQPSQAAAASQAASPYQHMAFPAVHPPRPSAAYGIAPYSAPFSSSAPSQPPNRSTTSTTPHHQAAWNNGWPQQQHQQGHGGVNGTDSGSSKARKGGTDSAPLDRNRKPSHWSFG
ncbi:hypothetical protein ACM66B_000798 [Microbotryomycetes sp. NB124-2]